MRVTHEQIPNTIKFLQIDFPALVLQTAGIEERDEYWQQLVEQIWSRDSFYHEILQDWNRSRL